MERAYNCTKWNWNDVGKVHNDYMAQLIIVPSGIEILDNIESSFVLILLIIVPSGIEISLTDPNPTRHTLL